jgi:hypothetical protein
MELLSQLGTDHAQEAFNAVQALPRVHNQGPTALLPWSDDFFRMAIFDQTPAAGRDRTTELLNISVNSILNATGPESFRADGEEMRHLLAREKAAEADNFGNLLGSWRVEGPLSEREHQTIFARSIARRSGIDENTVDVDQVVSRLNAHYTFEKQRLVTAAASPEYNFRSRENDVFDAELLIYLADPSLRLLTCDTGFRRASGSPQFNRVHVETHNAVRDADSAARRS